MAVIAFVSLIQVLLAEPHAHRGVALGQELVLLAPDAGLAAFLAPGDRRGELRISLRAICKRAYCNIQDGADFRPGALDRGELFDLGEVDNRDWTPALRSADPLLTPAFNTSSLIASSAS